MKHLLPIILFLLFSCTKESNTKCFQCTTEAIQFFNIPVEGYPKYYSGTETVCEFSDEDIYLYEDAHSYTETESLNQLTLTTIYSTSCK